MQKKTGNCKTTNVVIFRRFNNENDKLMIKYSSSFFRSIFQRDNIMKEQRGIEFVYY